MKAAMLALALMAGGLAGCRNQVNPRVATRLNDDARITGVPSNPMQDKVITSWVDRKTKSMSTMYGNDAAVGYARSGTAGGYPAGAVVSVVTWNQEEDPRWFGGWIPHRPTMVEYVTVKGSGEISYQRYEGYEGSALKQVANTEGVDPKDRAAYLLGQRAAVMP